MFSEAAVFVGFVLPGEAAVLLAGSLASTGTPSVVILAVVVVVAAIIGDSLGYEVGKRFGPRMLRWRMVQRHEHRVDRARAFLDGRGAPAIFLGRGTAFLRAMMPGIAGLTGMRYRASCSGTRSAAWSGEWAACWRATSRALLQEGRRLAR